MTTTRRAIAFITSTAATVAVLSAATAAATTTHRCQAEHLSLTVTQSGAAAGTTYYRLTLRNEATSPCILYGYPGVSAVKSPAGPQVGPAATRQAGRAVLVTIRPGGSAPARLGVAEVGNYSRSKCGPRTAAGLRVYPPGAYGALFARVRVEVCTRVASMSVTPVRSGP